MIRSLEWWDKMNGFAEGIAASDEQRHLETYNELIVSLRNFLQYHPYPTDVYDDPVTREDLDSAASLQRYALPKKFNNSEYLANRILFEKDRGHQEGWARHAYERKYGESPTQKVVNKAAYILGSETIALDDESIIEQIHAKTHIQAMPNITALPPIQINEITKIVTDEIKNSRKTKLELQLAVISEVIERLKYPSLAVPSGGVTQIKKKCISEYPNLFTTHSFDHAWKAGKKTKMKLWEVENPDQYKNK